MDQDRRPNGLCPWESCRVSPARALRENPLSLQSVPDWSEPAGQLHTHVAVCVTPIPPHGLPSKCYQNYVIFLVMFKYMFGVALMIVSVWGRPPDGDQECPVQLCLTAFMLLCLMPRCKSAYLRLWDWCCVTSCTGHSK